MDAAAGGRGGRLQRAYRGEVGRPLPGWRPGAARSLVAAAAFADATFADAGRGNRAIAAAADDRGRDRRSARAAAFDRLGLVEADRARQALAARPTGAA